MYVLLGPIFSSYKITSIIVLGPTDLILRNYIFKGLISKKYHIMSYWWLGHQLMNVKVTQF